MICEPEVPRKESADYETADPSFMAVGQPVRYWQKYIREVAAAKSQ